MAVRTTLYSPEETTQASDHATDHDWSSELHEGSEICVYRIGGSDEG